LHAVELSQLLGQVGMLEQQVPVGLAFGSWASEHRRPPPVRWVVRSSAAELRPHRCGHGTGSAARTGIRPGTCTGTAPGPACRRAATPRLVASCLLLALAGEVPLSAVVAPVWSDVLALAPDDERRPIGLYLGRPPAAFAGAGPVLQPLAVRLLLSH